MKKIICIFFVISIVYTQAVSQDSDNDIAINKCNVPFSIAIQDTLVVLRKKQEIVKLNIVLLRHIEEEILLHNFFKFITLPRGDIHPYIEKDNRLSGILFNGLYYFIQDDEGEFLDRGMSHVWDFVEKYICIDTIEMKITHVEVKDKSILKENGGDVSVKQKKKYPKESCHNVQLYSLSADTTLFTVYLAVKEDYPYKCAQNHIRRKNNEFYLTVYYMFPFRDIREGSLIVASNKVKIIIK
jgi:hypothetical protein